MNTSAWDNEYSCQGILAKNETVDFIADIFAYKYQTNSTLRRNYLLELNRVLNKTGLLFLSLSGKDDEYYAGCPQVENNNQGLLTIIDPKGGCCEIDFA